MGIDVILVVLITCLVVMFTLSGLLWIIGTISKWRKK